MDQSNPTVSIQDLTLAIGKNRLLEKFNLKLAAGEVVGITGPSGCGKTTLLRAIVSRQLPEGSTSDRFAIDDVPLSYCPQKGGLFPWYTVGTNIDLARNLRALDNSAQRSSRVDSIAGELIPQFQIGEMLDRYPSQISGGEFQRAALATAIISDPELLVADEPIAGIELNLRYRILNLLLKLRRERVRFTMLVVSHNVDLLLLLCDRILVIGEDGISRSMCLKRSDPSASIEDYLLGAQREVLNRWRQQISQLILTPP